MTENQKTSFLVFVAAHYQLPHALPLAKLSLRPSSNILLRLKSKR